MVELSEADKFELWESNGTDLYYRLRDVELHAEFIEEAANKLRDMIKKDLSKSIEKKAVQDAIQNTQKGLQKAMLSLIDLESTIQTIERQK